MARIDSFDPPEMNPDVDRPGPRRPSLPAQARAAVGRAWRQLRTMRTALWLLGGLAVESILATIVPQDPNVPGTVDAWLDGSEGPGTLVATALDMVGGFDVYGSPIFLALLVLLFTSLTACMLPRIRQWWVITRHSQPPRTRHVGAQDHVATVTTALPVDAALAASRGALAHRRYRLRGGAVDEGAGPPQVAAEKGLVAREGGSLVFHLSFYVLLAGIVFGQLLGFSGQVGLVEGDTFRDAEVAYWSRTPGRWFGTDDHTGFAMTLDQFDVEWIRSVENAGFPTTFRSQVTITDEDGTTYEDSVSGNDPLVVDGMKVHQLDWGYAPRVVVRQGDQVVFDDHVDANVNATGWFEGVVKAPAAEPDLGLELVLVPWAPEAADGSISPTGAPWADEPLLSLLPWVGDLGLEAAQDVRELETGSLEALEEQAGALRLGQTAVLTTAEGTDVEVTFAGLDRWVGFQVSYRPTVPLLLLGAGLALVGLVPALYAYRRRVWVAAAPTEDGRTLLTVAGRAFQRAEAFEDAFPALVEDVRARVGGTTVTSTDHEPDAAAVPAGASRTLDGSEPSTAPDDAKAPK